MTIRVCLIETSAPGSLGSMSRYATLAENAPRDTPGFEVQRISLAPSETQLQPLPRRLRTLAHHATIACRSAATRWQNSADLFHVIDGSHGYVTRWLPPTRTIVTAHDVIPALQARGFFPLPPPRPFARWIIRSSLRGVARVSRIISVSESTAKDLVGYAHVARKQISVVPLALPQDFLVPAKSTRDSSHSNPKSNSPFLFHLGNNGFYKNRLGVVRIFDRIHQQLPVRLVLAGPPPDLALRTMIHERSLGSSIDFVEDPSDQTILELYQSAKVFLFPSLYEGFGWPTLEAMAVGCPVVCSRQGSLPEVVGDAALTADSNHEEALAKHCLAILRDPLAAARLVAGGIERAAEFSFERFRESMINVYRGVFAEIRPGCGLHLPL